MKRKKVRNAPMTMLYMKEKRKLIFVQVMKIRLNRVTRIMLYEIKNIPLDLNAFLDHVGHKDSKQDIPNNHFIKTLPQISMK